MSTSFSRLDGLLVAPEAPTRLMADPSQFRATKLPPEYVDFLTTYGVGSVIEALYLFAPGYAHYPWSMAAKVDEAFSEIPPYQAEFPEDIPFPIYPDRGGLLAFAWDSRDYRFFWRTVGAPEDWATWVWPRGGPALVHVEGGFIDVLVALLEGRLMIEWDTPPPYAYVAAPLDGVQPPHL